jgi:predicted nucleotidyltransferase
VVVSTLVEALTARLAAEGDVVAAYLFGSQARGTAGPASDVDVAVLFGRRPAATLLAQPFALADELQGLVGRHVDLVVLDTAPPDLIHRVLRDGQLLLDRDPAARVRFEVAARNAYFDLLPTLERYRRGAV